MSILPKQPVNIGKVLDLSIQLYKVSFKKILVLNLLIGLIGSSFVYFNWDLLTKHPDPALYKEFFSEIGEYILFDTLIMLTAYVAVISRIHHVVIQQSDTLFGSCTVYFKKFFKLWLANILFCLFLALGLILLVIPGLYLMLSLSFAIYFIVLESAGAFRSLKASHQLVKGNWWRTSGVYTAPTIIYSIYIFAFGVFVKYQPNLNYVEALLDPFFVSYFLCLSYVQFHDLKLRKFGDDIAVRLEQ